MKRGDIITVAAKGDFGKPRPALVVQSDLFAGATSVTYCPLTSELREAPRLRITIEPQPGNGLSKTSQVMIDKIQTVSKARVGTVIGRVTDKEMLAINGAVRLWLGLI